MFPPIHHIIIRRTQEISSVYYEVIYDFGQVHNVAITVECQIVRITVVYQT